MEHYELTEKDMMICSGQNAKNHWGFSKEMLMYQLRKHKRAWVNLKGLDERQEDQIRKYERDIAMVEERLTDANFHKVCKLLSEHRYKECENLIKTEM